ncbi:MAG: DoxX family protein [Candidatus Neomarinimicrobiota bacterium]
MKFYNLIISKLSILKDFPPLFFRWLLAYGFYGTAIIKLNNFDNIIAWFTKMNIPFPTVNAYLATGAETFGFVLLFVGFATRIISIPLIIVMLVAIVTVHWGNGFDAGDNGSEIPLYYIAMLLGLIVWGPGKFSLDALVKRYFDKKNN